MCVVSFDLQRKRGIDVDVVRGCDEIPAKQNTELRQQTDGCAQRNLPHVKFVRDPAINDHVRERERARQFDKEDRPDRARIFEQPTNLRIELRVQRAHPCGLVVGVIAGVGPDLRRQKLELRKGIPKAEHQIESNEHCEAKRRIPKRQTRS
jgi:hypothetical protein